MRHIDLTTVVSNIVAFLVILLAIGAMYLEGRTYGALHGRCNERWQYQRTQTDTLQTIRSGCPFPVTKK